VRARPERRQRGEHGDHRPAGAEHDPGPLVQAAVGDARPGQRRDAAADAGDQLAPAVGAQQLVGHAAAEQRERHRGEGDEHGARRPQARRKPSGDQQACHRERARREGVPRPLGGGRLEQLHPLERAERAQRHEREAARRGHGEAGIRFRPRPLRDGAHTDSCLALRVLADGDDSVVP
jgi:hypothetical protein